MSEDQEDPQEDPAKMEILEPFYVPRVDFDATRTNVEQRLVDLRRDVDGQKTHVAAIDRLVNNFVVQQSKLDRRMTIVESQVKEQGVDLKVSKAERVGMLAIVQMMEKDVHETAGTVRKIEHLQMFGWALVGVLIIVVLFKVW